MASRFTEIVTKYGPRATVDLALSAPQAAGLFGNGDVESGGFSTLQEITPLVAGSAGGYGWVQWTGPRRRAYLAWCEKSGLNPASDEANYRYMVVELLTLEKAALRALRAAGTVDEAATVVCNKYLRPGIPHLDKRIASARRALPLLADGGPVMPLTPRPRVIGIAEQSAAASIPAGKWAEDMLPKFEVMAIQHRLIDLGYHTVGLADGIWGGNTTAAVKKLQEQAAASDPSIAADGHYGPQTKALLADDSNRAAISAQRAGMTANDLAKAGTPAVVRGRAIQWSSVLGFVTSAFGVVALAVQYYQAGAELPFPVSLVTNFLPPWVGMLVPMLAALYSALSAKGLIGASVERVREGIDNSGAPPVQTSSGVFGSFASLFERR